MKVNGRNQNGRFALGNPGGPGRPPIAKERRYSETLASVVTDDDWREICLRAMKDAKAGDHRAREWLSKYLLGEPAAVANVLHAHVNGEEENPFANASPEAIVTARAAIAAVRESADRNSQRGR